VDIGLPQRAATRTETERGEQRWRRVAEMGERGAGARDPSRSSTMEARAPWERELGKTPSQGQQLPWKTVASSMAQGGAEPTSSEPRGR
jgi:hypothetical protein